MDKKNDVRDTVQFSLKWVLCCTAAIALACVALMAASPLWVGIAFYSTVLSLFTAGLVATASVGRIRVASAGFAFGGCFYILSWMLTHNTTNLNPDYLPTHRLLRLAHESVSRELPWTPPPGYGPSPPPEDIIQPPESLFFTVGHFIWAWACGVFTAVLAKIVHRRFGIERGGVRNDS